MSLARFDRMRFNSRMRVPKFIARTDARHRFVFGLIAATAAFLTLRHQVRLSTDLIASWDTFAFFVLTMVWLTIVGTPAQRLRTIAQQQDFGRFLIFLSAVIAACAALFAVGFLISVNKGEIRGHFTVHLVLSLLTVIFSWTLLHTVFGLHYAHAFYGDSPESKEHHAGGLLFPGDRPPDYFDFAYYSFVVGMTCQVSDVQITSRRMRRLTLLHGMLSFGFNTLILALLINTVSSML
jgi:uncharacterized membrane protein